WEFYARIRIDRAHGQPVCVVMFRAFTSRFFRKGNGKEAGSPEPPKNRRVYKRHNTDRCVVAIRGRTFRVMNWGFGGIAIDSEDAVFIVGQTVKLDLKFKLSRSDLEVSLPGTVLRSYLQVTAFSFSSLDQMVKN